MERQASTFGKEERRIEESADAKLAEFCLVNLRQFFHKPKNIVVVGIDAQQVDPMGDLCGDVSVQEVQCAECDEEKRRAFQEFEYGNEHKSAGRLLGLSGGGHGEGETVPREKLRRYARREVFSYELSVLSEEGDGPG